MAEADALTVRAVGAEAAFLERGLAGIIAELERDELTAAVMKSRNNKLTERDALLVLTRIDALRGVLDRIRSRVRAGERAAQEG